MPKSVEEMLRLKCIQHFVCTQYLLGLVLVNTP